MHDRWRLVRTMYGFRASTSLWAARIDGVRAIGSRVLIRVPYGLRRAITATGIIRAIGGGKPLMLHGFGLHGIAA
jgi:hypothetical protein